MRDSTVSWAIKTGNVIIPMPEGIRANETTRKRQLVQDELWNKYPGLLLLLLLSINLPELSTGPTQLADIRNGILL